MKNLDWSTFLAACYNALMAGLSVLSLGKLEVWLDSQPLTAFRSRSVEALLILLTIEGGKNRFLRREWLIELIWPEISPDTGRKNLRQTLYELKQAIPAVADRTNGVPLPFILADRQQVWLNEECEYEVDARRFAKLVQGLEIDDLRAAVTLYRGDFLSDFYLPDNSTFEDWAAAKRALWRRLVLDGLTHLAEHDLRQGDFAQAEKYAWRQLAIDSLREKALQQLMISLALNGRRGQALEQYEKSRQELWRELGVEPAAETEAIYQEIRSGKLQESGGSPQAFLEREERRNSLAGEAIQLAHPSLESATDLGLETTISRGIGNNLPVESTPFVGRQRELQSLFERMVDPEFRLLTLLGPGGSGKTRLGVRLAANLLENVPQLFPDGVWILALSRVTGAGELVAALAAVLAFRAYDPEVELEPQLSAYLRNRKMLLILDNLEYIEEPEGIQLLADILSQAPKVKIIACSRVRLNIQMEQLFPVVGLEVPPEELAMAASPKEALDYTSVQLFLNSAQRVRPDYSLTAENVAAVLAICRQLQGNPLAIELAASWVELLSAAEIGAEIERDLDILQTDWHGFPDRQRSVKAVFDTSWRLLNANERAAFLRLSVFRGGFNRESARQVADVDLRVLLGLANKSWLQRQADGRYLPHEMLRQYAYQRLAEDEMAWRDAHDRHGAYYREFMAAQWRDIRGPEQLEANRRIGGEWENIALAWQWLTKQGQFSTLVDQMLPGLFFYHDTQGNGQRLVSLIRQTLEHLNQDDARRGEPWHEAVLRIAKAAFPVDVQVTRYAFDEYWFLKGDQEVRAVRGLVNEHHLEQELGIWSVLLAMLWWWVTYHQEGIGWLRELIVAYRRQNDPWLLAFTLESLGRTLMPTGRGRPEGEAGINEAVGALTEALSIFEAAGDLREQGHTLRLLGNLHRADDDHEAKRLLLAAGQMLREVGDHIMAASVGADIAYVCLRLGQKEEAFLSFRRVRRYQAQIGNQKAVASLLSLESIEALRYSSIEHARQTREEGLAVAQAIDDRPGMAWGTWEMGEIERVAGNYVDARQLFEEAKTLFSELGDPYGAIFYHRGLGDIALGIGHFRDATAHFEESLRLARRQRHLWAGAYALSGLGRAALREEDLPEALKRFSEGFQMAIEHGYVELSLVALAGLSQHAAADSRHDLALRLAYFALDQPLLWDETREQIQGVIDSLADVVDETQSEAARTWAASMTLVGVAAEVLS